VILRIGNARGVKVKKRFDSVYQFKITRSSLTDTLLELQFKGEGTSQRRGQDKCTLKKFGFKIW